MRTLSRRSYDEYCEILNGITEKATNGFAKSVEKQAYLFMGAPSENSRGVYRDFIIDEVYGRIEQCRAQAQVVADDLFEAMVGHKPTTHAEFPLEACDARVRSAAVHVFEHGNVGEFVRALETFIREEVRGAASTAVAENVEAANKR